MPWRNVYPPRRATFQELANTHPAAAWFVLWGIVTPSTVIELTAMTGRLLNTMKFSPLPSRASL